MFDPYAKRKAQRQCKHEWEFKQYYHTKSGVQGSEFICYKCWKKKRQTYAQQMATLKMQEGRSRKVRS
jgi:hypothetical protein